jgi:hypothetical protein
VLSYNSEVDYRASPASTGMSFTEVASGRTKKKVKLGATAKDSYWHARALSEDQVSPTSLCGLYEWSDTATMTWDDPTIRDRCAACVQKVSHPSPYGDDDLWEKNGFNRLRLCIVCGIPAAGFRSGPHAVLSLRKGHGRTETVASQVVAVHHRCVAEAEAIAHEQGYEWKWPPGPDTGWSS